MSILTDALIDAKADLCWNHQQQQLKKEVETDCICTQLADMIYLTRQEIAKEIEDYRVDRCRCEQDLGKDCDALLEAIEIARGKND
jgi:hypothetical protein